MFSFDSANFVGSLQVQPKLISCAEKSRQANSGIGADAAPLQNNVIYSGDGNPQLLGKFVGGHAQRLQKLLPQNFAWMHSPVRSSFTSYGFVSHRSLQKLSQCRSSGSP